MGKNGGGGGERGERREERGESNTMRDIHLTCRDARRVRPKSIVYLAVYSVLTSYVFRTHGPRPKSIVYLSYARF